MEPHYLCGAFVFVCDIIPASKKLIMDNRTISEVIESLKKTKSKEECLKKAYDILSEKYRGHRLVTYLKIHYLLLKDLNKIWGKSGFLPCTTLNYLLKNLLIKSGWFSESDIKIKWALIWFFSPHQYLSVRISKEKSINVDLWGRAYGIKFGDYAHGLRSGSVFHSK